MKKRILFICNGNVNRSRTAEDMFRNSAVFVARSAGIEPHAALRVSQRLIDWADVIFVMNESIDRQLSYIKRKFDVTKPVFDLRIENMFRRGDPLLIGLIKRRLLQFAIVPE